MRTKRNQIDARPALLHLCDRGRCDGGLERPGLERSRRLLRNPRHATATIATIASIAHAYGFGDLSYFNRTFRRGYGTTPSDFRNGS